MRVLVDARLALRRPTGIGRYLAGLLGSAAEDTAAELHVVTSPMPPPWLADLSGVAQLHRAARPHNAPLGVLDLAGLERRLRPNLTHHPHVTPALLLGQAPQVVTVHDAKHLTRGGAEASGLSRARRLTLSGAFRASVGRADAVIAVSRATAEALQHLRDPARRPVDVVHEATDLSPPSRQQIRHFLARRSLERPYVLNVGETRPHKNHVRLIEAWSRTSAATSHDLVIIGQPHASHDQVLAAASRWPGRVHVLTDVTDDELPGAYGGAAAFALPSLVEGFGLPLLEAMACGVPVITSRGGACEEVTGGEAELVDPFSVTELANALDRILGIAEVADDLAARGRRRADAFSWTATARGTMAVWRAVAQ